MSFKSNFNRLMTTLVWPGPRFYSKLTKENIIQRMALAYSVLVYQLILNSVCLLYGCLNWKRSIWVFSLSGNRRFLLSILFYFQKCMLLDLTHCKTTSGFNFMTLNVQEVENIYSFIIKCLINVIYISTYLFGTQAALSVTCV